jgi:flagellar basal body-associated protein FliL
MKKKKLAIVAVIALVIAGGAYKTVLAKPKAAAKKPNVEGTIYVLQKEFLVNLAGDRYAKISAALLLSHADTSTAGGGGHGAPVPPEGYGPMPQEAVVRDIITDSLTGLDATELEDSKKRDKLRLDIVGRIHKETDVKAEAILFPDLTVQ